VILRHVQDFQQGLREDRKSLFTGDLLRSLLLAGVAGLAIWLRLRGVIKGSVALASIGLLMLMDIFPIDVEYLNESNYVEEEGIAEVFTPAPYNLEIAKDTGSYRVLDLSRGVSAAFNGNALTAVFHRSIGGYHAAKLSIYQDLIEKQLYKYPDCQPTLDMLNTRYVIFNDPATNQITFRYNPSAAGDCWFVASVRGKDRYKRSWAPSTACMYCQKPSWKRTWDNRSQKLQATVYGCSETTTTRYNTTPVRPAEVLPFSAKCITSRAGKPTSMVKKLPSTRPTMY